MKIYWLSEQRLSIQRPRPEKPWISESDRAAYKCKPMRDASSMGWQIVMPCNIDILWDGGTGTDAIHIECSDENFNNFAVSHFKFGLVSFVVNAVFRTSPGFDTYITGPINGSKRGLTPLSARIETDWLPFHFAMTWRIVEPGLQLRFEKGEPFAQFMEVARSQSTTDALEHYSILEDSELLTQYASFLEARQSDAREYEAEAVPRRPLGYYDRGEYADGSGAVDEGRRPIVRS